MTVICPNCGCKHAETLFAEELVDFIFVLPLKEKDVLVRLIKARGGQVSHATLYDYIYSGEGEEGPLTSTLYSHVSKLKKKLRGSGWDIESQRHEGYRLVKVQP